MGRQITIATTEWAAPICIQASTPEYAGLKRVADYIVSDMKAVTGADMCVLEQLEDWDKVVIVAGTIGENHWIDKQITNGILAVDGIRGKRESYVRQVIENPMPGVDAALVIAGSEKLGTIYGMLSLSDWMGVSPWIYWGDVKPGRKTELVMTDDEWNRISKEPSVKYRAFFMNDEWPSLGNWMSNTFGDFNDKFYERVFELLLRLKGNYFWPAMWSASFCLDGSEYPMQNADLAQELGIYMGNSHHEPMMRASEEWDKVKSDDNSVGYGKDWNYYTNQRGLHQYWEDSIIRNKDYNNLITIGMRGERDTSMLGDFSSLKENIDLLKKIITDQKDILVKHGLKDAPKMLALYKEVEDYFYGDKDTEGLKDWDGLDDVLLLLSDDNFANMRTLPTANERDRKAGWGIYYHFDYHGAPISYEWVNSTPLTKTWEQMTMAYEYGIRDLWIVNVGDVRPQELPLSYFMEMAYDYEKWGTGNIDSAAEYLKLWTKQQFGAYVDAEQQAKIVDILNDYTRMNGNRRPEATGANTFSQIHYGEADTEIERAISLETRTEALKEQMPDEVKDAYHGLVYFPAMGSANVRLMNLYAGKNQLYASRGEVVANQYKKLVENCIARDAALVNGYQTEMAAGKWNGMMMSAHIGFQAWNDEGWKVPDTYTVTPVNGSLMLVSYEGKKDALAVGKGKLPDFHFFGLEKHKLWIGNGGEKAFDYQIHATDTWLLIDKPNGTVTEQEEVTLSIDWDACAKVVKYGSAKTSLTVEGNGQKVDFKIRVRFQEKLGDAGSFMESHSYIAMEAEHYKEKMEAGEAEWKVIPNYGKTLSSIKMFPTTVEFENPKDAPYVEYEFMACSSSQYQVRLYLAPSNNTEKNKGMRYAVAIDDREPIVVESLPDVFAAGSYYDPNWCNYVLDNVRTSESSHMLTYGMHRIRIYGMDAGLVIQKIVIYRDELPDSYYGPKESVRVE